MIKLAAAAEERVCQGDVFRDVHFIEDVAVSGEHLELKRILFPYVIVLTQDCDLQQDHNVRWPAQEKPTNQDKRILSTLVAPLYNAEHIRSGEHLSDLNMTMQSVPKGSALNNLLSNQNQRYHCLKFPQEIQLVDSVIDFKHYFSVSVEYLKRIKPEQFVCQVGELYREDISHRFAAFLSRIGLPNEGAAPDNAAG